MQSICHLIYILIYSLYYSANRVKGDNRCYVCSNMDVKNVVAHIQDTKWKSWLSRAATDPKINDCNDNFNVSTRRSLLGTIYIVLGSSGIAVRGKKSRMRGRSLFETFNQRKSGRFFCLAKLFSQLHHSNEI